MGFTERIKVFGVSKALDYLEKDPDANLPKLMEWVQSFAGDRVPDKYRILCRQALSDPANNWYQLIKSMYSDIDNQVLKKIFENFIIHGGLLDWVAQSATGGWPKGAAPWATLIDPTLSCEMECEGCGAAVYGVRPEMEFDSLDEEIISHKERGTHLYIAVVNGLAEREEEVIALCNKHSDCVFAVFTSAWNITEELASDMVRVRNLFPAIRMGTPYVGDSECEAVEKLRRYRLPFGIACPCTSENIDEVGTEEYYDRLISAGAKFCWFLSCPALSHGKAADREKMYALHQRVKEFRKTKALLTLDFCDKPSLSSVVL